MDLNKWLKALLRNPSLKKAQRSLRHLVAPNGPAARSLRQLIAPNGPPARTLRQLVKAAKPAVRSLRRRLSSDMVAVTVVALMLIASTGIALGLARQPAGSAGEATPTPSGSSVAVIPSPTDTASATDSTTPSSGATRTPTRTAARTPVRTPVPTPPGCPNTNLHNLNGSMRYPDGLGAAGAVWVYVASNGQLAGSATVGNPGTWNVRVRPGTYKILFAPSGGKSEWWNNKATVDAADTVYVCATDVNVLDAVVARSGP